MTWHPELMPAVLEGGRRDVELLNSGRTCLALRLPYVDLDEAEQLAALFEGELGTDQPICGVMVLPPAAAGEPPARVPSLQWDLVLRGSSERTARFQCSQLLELSQSRYHGNAELPNVPSGTCRQMNTPNFPESLTEIEIMHGEAMKEYWQMRVEILISIDSKRDDLVDAWDCIWKEIDHYFLHECSDSRPEAIAFIREKLIEWAQRNTPYNYRNKLVQNMLDEKRKVGGNYLRASMLIKKIFGR